MHSLKIFIKYSFLLYILYFTMSGENVEKFYHTLRPVRLSHELQKTHSPEVDLVFDLINIADHLLKHKTIPWHGQLGLVETIYADGTRESGKNSSKFQTISEQQYDYVICVDFEATCWESLAPPKWRESEIIEFPAVLLNVKTGKIEGEFKKYVMPIESPRLSAFCTNFTGITQDKVENGIPLQTAFMVFQEWLRKELRNRNLVLPKQSKENKLGNCVFVTWSDWDFGTCLAKECARKRLKKPQFFNQWIDLRTLYRDWYKYKPLNFSDALRNVGLEFEGREHCGLDDSKNLAKLVHKMCKDGVILTITKDLTPFQLNVNYNF